MIGDDACGQCARIACAQSCAPTPLLDRRRFIVDLSRYALGTATLGGAGLTVVQRAAAARGTQPLRALSYSRECMGVDGGLVW